MHAPDAYGGNVFTRVLILTAAAFGGWVLIYAIVFLAQPRARRGATAIGLGEWPVDPPALAALLCQPYRRIVRCGAWATLIDLAARGYVSMDMSGPVPSVRATITPPYRPGPALQPYERHIYDLVAVRAAAGGGVVPLDALRLGSGEHTKDWQRRFVELLESDGRRRGLVRDRARRAVRVLLRTGLLVPFGLICLYAQQAHSIEAAAFTGFILLGIGTRVAVLRHPVPSELGAMIAAQCRQLGSVYMGADRRTAYAAAVDRTGNVGGPFVTIARRSPVWSAAAGDWRQVRVVDRERWDTNRLAAGPPLPGPRYVQTTPRDYPVIANAGIVVFAGSWAVLLTLATEAVLTGGSSIVTVGAVGIGWLLWALGASAFVRSQRRRRADRSLPPITMVGQVVYLESHVGTGDADTFFVAVDDGRSERVVRRVIEQRLHDSLRLGMWLRIDLTATGSSILAAQILSEPPRPVPPRTRDAVIQVGGSGPPGRFGKLW